MAHVLFGSPAIARFHLHERLQRELRARGHRVTVLCTDAVAATFWAAQSSAVVHVAAAAPEPLAAPLQELAAGDCRRRRRPVHGPWLRRATTALARRLPNLLRLFDADCPDLVLLHQQRSGCQRLIQHVAGEYGSRVLWTGDGLLPHTLQLDEQGLDGDATAGRRSAFEYRTVRSDGRFLAAALSALLGRTAPVPLSRRLLRVPPWRARVRDALLALLGQDEHGALAAFDAWRTAAPRLLATTDRAFEPPTRAFVTVLLQREDDDRLLLDAVAAPRPVDLVRAVRAATATIRPMSVVAVLPTGGLLASELAPLRRLADVQLEHDVVAADAAATATAVVTVNHPLAVGALLAGTPVLHLGRALYGVAGIAHHTQLDTLAADLPFALGDDQPELRLRFLTWLLAHGHVWCSPDLPDHNGIAGLVLEIETRLAERSPTGARLRYRAGPAWPLAVESPGP